jgi:hypothetical protein
LEQRASGDGGAERHPETLLGNTPAPSQDARLIARAIRQKWDIPPAVFKKLPQQVLAIFEKKKEGTRERLRAAELILKMHGQNEGEKTEINLSQQVAVVNGDAKADEQLKAMYSSMFPPTMVGRVIGEMAEQTKHGSDSGKPDGTGSV